MANIFIFLMNSILALIALVFTVIWFLPSLLVRGYRKLLGLDT